jgi:hypothetical protein
MGIASFETLCKLCKHRRGITCTAYPKLIPLEIRLMHVDHRQHYRGDGGVTFEPKDDSEDTLRRLSLVRVRKGRVPAGPNALDRRVAPVVQRIPWESARQQYRFARAVEVANSFEELPEWCRELILEAERQGAMTDNPSGQPLPAAQTQAPRRPPAGL